MATRPLPTLPERLTDRVRRLLRRVEALRGELAQERIAHADTRELWRRQHDDLAGLIEGYKRTRDAHQQEIGENPDMRRSKR